MAQSNCIDYNTTKEECAKFDYNAFPMEIRQISSFLLQSHERSDYYPCYVDSTISKCNSWTIYPTQPLTSSFELLIQLWGVENHAVPFV